MRSYRIVAASAAVFAGALALGVASSQAASPITTTFQAKIKIVDDCKLLSATDMVFPDTGFIDSAVTQTSTINVTCTKDSVYNIGLDEGTTAGGTITTRKMTDGTETIDYELWQDGGYTQNWGETIGTDTLSATGNGASQAHTIHGRVPAQTTPTPGDYADTVTVTVSF